MMVHLSEKAYKEQQDKLDQLKAKRKKISKTIGEAIEQGDLSENSAYHEAKKDQGLNEAKIARLEEALRHVVVGEHVIVDEDIVDLGMTVKLKKLNTKEELEFTVVSELEADYSQKKISDVSPLGSALIGHEINDVVDVNAPNGIVKYKILKISRK